MPGIIIQDLNSLGGGHCHPLGASGGAVHPLPPPVVRHWLQLLLFRKVFRSITLSFKGLSKNSTSVNRSFHELVIVREIRLTHFCVYVLLCYQIEISLIFLWIQKWGRSSATAWCRVLYLKDTALTSERRTTIKKVKQLWFSLCNKNTSNSAMPALFKKAKYRVSTISIFSTF